MYSMKERRLDSSQTEIISCVRRREQLMVRDSIKYIKKKKKSLSHVKRTCGNLLD
jgi:hypothetical protein